MAFIVHIPDGYCAAATWRLPAASAWTGLLEKSQVQLVPSELSASHDSKPVGLPLTRNWALTVLAPGVMSNETAVMSLVGIE